MTDHRAAIAAVDSPSTAAYAADDLLAVWPHHRPTRLLSFSSLARHCNVAHVLVKAEWERPLGNFKSLGGQLAGLRALARHAGFESIRALLAADASTTWPVLICASDGNHGLAVAAAAARVGARAHIHLPEAVPAQRADRIVAQGGHVRRVAGTYDDAVASAAAAAARGDGLLIADTGDHPLDPVVADVMAGYAVIGDEIDAQLGDGAVLPSHLLIQAGVGGLAAAMAERLHARMRDPRRIVVVEPSAADCVAQALVAGAPRRITGDLRTDAEMLACGTASAQALAILCRHRAQAVAIDEPALRHARDLLRDRYAVRTTASGAAGLAGLLRLAEDPSLRDRHALDARSCVLLVVTEGDPELAAADAP